MRFRIDFHFDKRHFLWWWQRRRRGFDDRELWSLDYVIAKFVYPRLRAFRDTSPVTPCISDLGEDRAPTKEEWDAAYKEWDDIMGEMVEGFRLMAEHGNWDLDRDASVKVDRSLDLFREWFHSLWW